MNALLVLLADILIWAGLPVVTDGAGRLLGILV